MRDWYRYLKNLLWAVLLLFVCSGQIMPDLSEALEPTEGEPVPAQNELDEADRTDEADGVDAASPGPATATEGRAARRPPSPVSMRTYWSDPLPQTDALRALAVVIDVKPPYHINPAKDQITPGFEFLIPTSVEVAEVPPGVTIGRPQFPPTHDMTVNFTGEAQQVAVLEGQVVIYLPVRGASAETTLKLAVTYQACDPTSCLMPQTVTLTTSPGGAESDGSAETESAELFASFDADAAFVAPADAVDVPPTVDDESLIFDFFGLSFGLSTAGVGGLLLLMFVAGVGGMMLNFTPCVLPVIPLKIMSLSHAAGTRGRVLLLGATMALGVVLFWISLGAAMAMISGFTAANQLFHYPEFTITVGVIIAVLAVGMCGLFSVPLPQKVYSFVPRQDTVVGSIGFGVMTAVLSTPCTAPLMGGAAAWAAAQPPLVTMLVFFAIGFGMALPYLVLSAFPQLVEKVPRSGPGSVLVKQVMGLLMLAVASFFIGIGISGWLTDAGEAPNTMYWWAVVGFVAAAAVWLAVRVFQISESEWRRGAALAVAVLTLAGSAWFGLSATGNLNSTERDLWTYYTPARYAAAQQRGDVVVMDFTAEWCLNCKVLERTVLADDRVVAALQQEGVLPMKVDLTPADNADAAAMLAAVDRVTIPLLVVFDSSGREVFKSDAYTRQQVIDAVAKAQQAR